MSEVILQAEDIYKSYKLDRVTVPVLKGAKLTVQAGEFVSILGVSGSGKSTLLHILGALDTPDRGIVRFRDMDIFSASEIIRCRLRNEHFGFVFQFYHLFPEFTVLENVIVPAMVMVGVSDWLKRGSEIEERGYEVLRRFGLGHRVWHLPAELSGGERQRVAIARAVFNSPDVLFADEPTGNLDEKTSLEIFETLVELNREVGQTIIMVTHDSTLAQRTNRVLHLHDGVLVE